MMFDSEKRHVVASWPGEGTGDTIYQDNYGRTYRLVSESEAQQIRGSTAGQVARLYSDGTIR